MNALTFPVKAEWAPGRKKDSKVLCDPYGNRYMRKSKSETLEFFWCGRKDIRCPIRVSLDIENDVLLSALGEHHHDSDLLGKNCRTCCQCCV